MSLPFDLDAFVRDYQRPLQLVQKIERVETDRFGTTLFGGTTQFQRKYRERYGTTVEVGVPGACGDEFVMRIEFCSPEILRFRFTSGNTIPENRTPMVVDDFADRDFSVTIQKSETTVMLMTSALMVTLQFNPWRMTIRDHTGQKLYETLPAAVFQHPPTGESHLDGASITDAWPWFFRDLYPLGFVHDDVSGRTQIFDTAILNHDEHFYGFGEVFSTLDKRGQMINLWHANATGNTWPLSYKNVPLFMSSRGFGLFLNSAYPIRYHMGDLSHTRYSMHVQHDLLDYYFIYGPTYKQILPRYTSITGQPGLPPLWSFGLWMSRMSWGTQGEVEHVASELRARDVPCDVIHIDSDWFKKPWVSDLKFSSERFPDPLAMIVKLREQGFRLTLWQLPYIGLESELYAEGVQGGYFARREDGTPWHLDGFFGAAAVIDYSNPEAVKWIQSKFEPLFAMGVAAIKTDFGEGAPPEAKYATRDGLEMHNLYPLLYNQAIFEKTKECTGDGIVWGRSVYAGSQRFPVQWSGDAASLWEDLGNLWHGGLGLGLCGFPFWSVDIGGFAGTPSPELYIRWAQAGLFVSHPRAHGPIHREPWAFGEQALEIFRKYAKLRYGLMPYVWSTANASVRTSQPVMRPMLLDWQDDPTTATIDDQFLFGEWILVAPILDESDQRQVYLPRGKWFDYWTGQRISGPRWIKVNAPLDMLPLFVRGGAIIPMAPDMSHIGEKAWNPLTLEIYPHSKTAFTLFDGDEQIDFECEEWADRAIIRIGPSQRRFHLKVHHANGVATLTTETRGAAVELSVDF